MQQVLPLFHPEGDVFAGTVLPDLGDVRGICREEACSDAARIQHYA